MPERRDPEPITTTRPETVRADDTQTVGGNWSGHGRRIGPYRLIRELDRGGMGTVYLAGRADGQFHRQVALKVVRSQPGGRDDVVGRMRRERRILASLEHPNIARFLDGGATDDGDPYFVMEYVHGLPIDQYCDRNKLSTTERLTLFRSVCAAVQHAHRNLIVHRDLKPKNMLVTPDGVPKLLDFGIAKLINPEVWGETSQTGTGLGPFTPAFASPEQVRGEPITTAADVYSLGVMLYLLLTGRLPYRVTGQQPLELLKVVMEQEPERPSAVVVQTTSADTLEDGSAESLSRLREGTTQRLQTRLKGDLDTILLAALRKEPERRYPSVEAFSEDIRRHLDGLPVKARRSTLSYRTHKFLARHRAGVVLSAAVLVLLLGSWIALAVQSVRLIRERDRVAGEAAKAEAVNAFMQEMLGSAHPFDGVGRDVTVIDALGRAVERIDESFREQPEIRTALQTTIGSTYRELGRYDEAEPLFRASLQTRRSQLGDEHPDVAESLTELATLRRRRGDFDEALELHQQALAIRRATVGEPHVDVAESLDSVATLLQQRGGFAAAEPLFREALEMRTELLGEEHERVAESLNNLATLLEDQRDYDAAELLYRRALRTTREQLGDAHPSVAIMLSNLANMFVHKGDPAAGEHLYEEADAIFEKTLGPDHWMLAHARSNHAACLTDLGRHRRAEELLLAATPVLRRELGDEHPRSQKAFQRLVALYESWDKRGEAASYAALLKENAEDSIR